MLGLFAAVILVTVASAFLITMVVAYIRTGVPTIVSARAAQLTAANYLRDKHVQRVYELGAGKGDFALRLAQQLPHAHIEGFELSLFPFLISKILQRFNPAGRRVRFHLIDFRDASLKRADAVVFYLMPHMNRILIPKLEKEMRPGTYVITVSFSMRTWKPEAVLLAPNRSKTRVFVYRIGSHVQSKP